MKYVATLFAVLFVAAGCGDDLEGNNLEPSPDAGPDMVADAGELADAAEDVGVDSGRELPPEPWSIYERGPYEVSWTSYEFTYDAVGEPERTIRVAAWYPTWTKWGPRDSSTARYYNLLNREGVVDTAEPALEGPLPVLVFSHGNSSFAEQSFYMTEFFASHGWLVLAPDHTGNTFFDNTGAINLSSALFRPQDITALLDDVYDLPDDHIIAGMAGDDIVMSGHSFGGFTTLSSSGADFAVDDIVAGCDSGELDQSLCDAFTPEQLDRARMGFVDDRIDVAIPQTPAGAEVFRENLAMIDIPTLLMTAEFDVTLPNEEEGDPIWALMDAPSVRLDMLNAGHFTYSNMCDIVPVEDGCGEESIEPELAREIINAYSMAFARWHLWGVEEDRAIATGEEVIYDENIVISTK